MRQNIKTGKPQRSAAQEKRSERAIEKPEQRCCVAVANGAARALAPKGVAHGKMENDYGNKSSSGFN